MKIHFLGTGDSSQRIKKSDDVRDIRRSSSILIDDMLLVDPGPDIFKFEKDFGYSGLYDETDNYLCTHKHKGHYSKISALRLGAKEVKTKFFKPVETQFFNITALPANHPSAKSPKCFVIESKTDGRRIFYGGDGAMLLSQTAQVLDTMRFDVMIFEATLCEREGDIEIFEHNNLNAVKELAKVFSKKADKIFISHIGSNSSMTHSEITDMTAEWNVGVAYDDLKIEI